MAARQQQARKKATLLWREPARRGSGRIPMDDLAERRNRLVRYQRARS
jgi:hypothetical protein